MVKDEYGNVLKGFYVIGMFNKGRRPKMHVQTQKPFVTNENGRSMGKCFCSVPSNYFASDWLFIENKKLKDIDNDLELRKEINEIWKGWCKKHKRKFEKAMEE